MWPFRGAGVEDRTMDLQWTLPGKVGEWSSEKPLPGGPHGGWSCSLELERGSRRHSCWMGLRSWGRWRGGGPHCELRQLFLNLPERKQRSALFRRKQNPLTFCWRGHTCPFLQMGKQRFGEVKFKHWVRNRFHWLNFTDL